MRQGLILAATHVATLSLGFAAGIYALPILTAPPPPDAAALASTEKEALYTGRFERRLKGSDFVHWGDGNVMVLRDRVAHIGHLSLARITSSISLRASRARRTSSLRSSTFRAVSVT